MGIKFKNPMVRNIWALISLQDCKIKGGGKNNNLYSECVRQVLKLCVFDFMRKKKE